MDKRLDLAELFEEHELRVFTYFRRLVAEPETAADLTQETFLRALRVAHRFRGDSTVTTWLLGIARRIFLEWVRQKRPPPRDGLERLDTPEPPVGDAIDVERALGSLAPEHREVLVLRFVLDLSGEEVAGVLGISHDSVRQRTTRAKRAFRDVWEP